jgi:hypothetical protein
MFRRKTVEALMRQYLREKEQLLASNRELTNQIMYLTGKAWEVPPSEPLEPEIDETVEESYANATDGVVDDYEDGGF